MMAAAAVTGYSAYSKTDMSNLLTANVEALASGESGKTCWKTITTKDGSQVLYCATCTWISGTYSWSSGKGDC